MDRNIKIILINSPKNTGKSTFCDMVTSQYKDVGRLSFASNLKNFCYNYLFSCKKFIEKHKDFSELNVFGDDGKKNHIFKLDDLLITEMDINTFGLIAEICDNTVYKMPRQERMECQYLIKDFLYEYRDTFSARKLLQFIGTNIIRDRISEDYHIRLLINEINNNHKSFYLIDDWRFQNELDILRNKGFNTLSFIFNKNNLNDEHISENSLLKADHVLELKNGYVDSHILLQHVRDFFNV